MLKRAVTTNDELVGKVTGLVRTRMSGAKAQAAADFVSHFYANVPPDDIKDREPEDLYGAALSMWAFGQTRGPDELLLRVFTPRFEEHGWHSTHTVIEIVNDDMPFLVDSVTMELNRLNLTVHLIIHPVYTASRDKDGRSLEFKPREGKRNGAGVESFMHLEIDEQTSPEALAEIENGVRRVLRDVRASVEDWPTMRGAVHSVIDELKKNPPKRPKEEIEEAVEFLQWIYDDHFTFTGYRETELSGSGERAKMKVLPDTGLGVLRDPQFSVFEGLRNLGKMPPEVQHFLRQPDMIRVTKANVRSTVHRNVHMDTIAIKRYDDKGKVVGERQVVGLLTSVAYNQSPFRIPLLRSKVGDVMARFGYDRGGHSGKALAHILETYPRDELFQIDVDTLAETAQGILHLQERQRIALFLRRDPFERFMSALVYVPRERFNTTLRKSFEAILSRTFGGPIVAHYGHLSDEALARVHFIIKTAPGQIPKYDREEVEFLLQDAARTWGDRIRQVMIEAQGEEKGLNLYRRYADAFPTSYREVFSVQTGAYDIRLVEEALETGLLGVNLYHPIEAEPNKLRFKIYHRGGPVVLSQIMPMMENMGVRVIEEHPFEVRPLGHDQTVYIHDFGLETQAEQGVDFTEVRTPFHECFSRVWNGAIEDDGFNRLVLRVGLAWREIVVLRAYCKFLRQVGIPFSQAYMEETLARNAELAADIVKLFELKFDPAIEHGREQHVDTLAHSINERLDEVENLDEDRILRRFVNLVRSTLRTNFYQTGDNGEPKTYVSFKFASRGIDEVPAPAPLREIFVYSPRFEAVHLRFGLVARGGLRWSDRREDFRTEVLGLVKAQQVKNAVIVPVGSKGGFVLKRAPSPADREAFLTEGVTCYRSFMSGMLDVTDNLDGDDVVPPPQVVRGDGDDPYLVVAADKGTATFSDYANEMATSYGFWLGDAFASGGSAGYDHKKMGITARGGWESVKRHFREMGHDTQSQDFSVVGVGDMSGDVFGNGMLLSKHIKLIGAFNHLHIFIDPDPDPAKSFAERKRLFGLQRSSWSDYNTKLISKGGGVFDRKLKSVKLTSEIKAVLDIAEDEMTPNDLINHMLKAPVDLLWFGGIGTYVKESGESNVDAGDRANDPVRVNANQLRCKVLGEGANLGVTHRARIEYAQAGGRCNTDAIDNSAGVDCSDHEVNIKILLGDIVARGDMTGKQRNALLEEMTDDVAAHVLRDNYQQTQAISVIQSQATRQLDVHQRLIRAMERAGQLDRALEFLPDDEEFDERNQAHKGLTRPELSVLLAYAKNITYQQLLDSDLPDDTLLGQDLTRYFPPQIQQQFPEAIERHRLRREIIATSVTNSMINRAGPSFVNEMQRRTGSLAPEIARAYTITREVFDLRPLWTDIEALDNKAPAEAQALMLYETNRTIDRMTEWFLRNEEHPLEIRRNIEKYRPGVEILKANLEDILGPVVIESVRRRNERFVFDGVPKDLVVRVGQLKTLSAACDVVQLATGVDKPVQDVGRTYTGVGQRFGLDWLRSVANRLPVENHWQRLAIAAIIDDLWGLQAEITAKVLQRGETGEQAIGGWSETRGENTDRVDTMLNEFRQIAGLDLAMLAVVNRELRNLAGT